MVVEALGLGRYGLHESPGRAEIGEAEGAAQGLVLESPHGAGGKA